MNWSRLTPWLIGAAAAMLLAGTLGYTIGTGSSTTTAEADSARQESYDAAYQSTFSRFETTARKMGLASGSKRGIRAGRKTGGREGTDLGRGVTSGEAARIEAEEAAAAEAAAEAELADRQANCGTIRRAPEICPTTAELGAYQAAVAAARQPVEVTPDEP